MKLILANNHTQVFKDFYEDLASKSDTPFDYSSYDSLLFCFDMLSDKAISVQCLSTGKQLEDYDGVYINGYLDTYELAASVAIACNALGIGYVNRELDSPPSLSKLSMYAKLAAAKVPIPKTYAGTKNAIMLALESNNQLIDYPAILKRADADRGIDNFKVASPDQVKELLNDKSNRSLWVLQDYIDNQGFYLVSFYNSTASFSIYRSLEARPDGNSQKAHMYKPKGGANAQLVELDQLPARVMEACQKSVIAMNRQIASVDCLYSKTDNKAYVLEVNYNPQLVTIETYKDVRIAAFLDNIDNIK
jgi:hypothetical protein